MAAALAPGRLRGMTNTDELRNNDVPEEPAEAKPAETATPKSPTRRRILAGAVGGGLGLAAGAVGAAAALQGAGTPPVVEPAAARRFQDKVVIITGATSGIGRA